MTVLSAIAMNSTVLFLPILTVTRHIVQLHQIYNFRIRQECLFQLCLMWCRILKTTGGETAVLQQYML